MYSTSQRQYFLTARGAATVHQELKCKSDFQLKLTISKCCVVHTSADGRIFDVVTGTGGMPITKQNFL